MNTSLEEYNVNHINMMHYQRLATLNNIPDRQFYMYLSHEFVRAKLLILNLNFTCGKAIADHSGHELVLFSKSNKKYTE